MRSACARVWAQSLQVRAVPAASVRRCILHVFGPRRWRPSIYIRYGYIPNRVQSGGPLHKTTIEKEENDMPNETDHTGSGRIRQPVPAQGAFPSQAKPARLSEPSQVSQAQPRKPAKPAQPAKPSQPSPSSQAKPTQLKLLSQRF